MKIRKMKSFKIFLFIGVLALGYSGNAQDVIVTLSARILDTPVELDSILLTNLSNSSETYLTSLPIGITTYEINLSTLSEILEKPGSTNIQVYRNYCGLFQFFVSLQSMQVLNISIYNLVGKQVYQGNLKCTAGVHLVDLHNGVEGISIIRIKGDIISACYKIIGDTKYSTTLALGNNLSFQNISMSLKNSVSGFKYSPGDVVRFTANKKGISGVFSNIPKNMDSILISLAPTCTSTPWVTDVDGNTYLTVQIGDQCWMRENLRTTHYSDGSSLVDGKGIGNITFDLSTKYYFSYNDSLIYSLIYGKLYTFAGLMNDQYSGPYDSIAVQGVCPDGWHVPRDVEWTQLINFLGGDSIAGGKMKEIGFMHWLEPNQGASNSSGFTALPGGFREAFGLFHVQKLYSYWWTSFMVGGSYAFDRVINYNTPIIYVDPISSKKRRSDGLSVRCIKN